ncbi:MAG: pseudouridine synthase [Bradyrhizobiaceae bacterium]|nr:pseudouridine synthase [Bradyrhizobiaceae bacterium]
MNATMARNGNHDTSRYGDRKRDHRPWRRGKMGGSATASIAPAPKRDAERLAKVIARAGLCSRRHAETWIAAGRVSVNGERVVSPALNVTPKDQISVDGKPLPERERTRLFRYHKPAGLVTTNEDPEGRPTIFSALRKDLPRLLTVGRLDIGTEGLLLLTNDGGLARVLELPATGWLRRYRVRAHGLIRQDQLDRLRSGLTVEGVHYGPIEATLDRTQGTNAWLTVAIREGRNREVRNVLGALGLQVNRLIRVSFGPFQLADLPVGEVEEVTTRVLREQLGERVAQIAGCDFSAPILSIPAHPDATSNNQVSGRAPRKGRSDRSQSSRHPRSQAGRSDEPPHKSRMTRTGDAWRDYDASGKRTFHGSRADKRSPPEEVSERRAGLLRDRQGRNIPVERVVPQQAPKAAPKPKHRRRPPRDRSGGPRPSRPRGR